jgi:DtxR family Mn-dependent transcriptional regulator
MGTKHPKPAPAPPLKLELTQTMREYLKSAYRLTVGDSQLTVTSLAESQEVAPASATAMVKKLTALGLMTHHHYGTISLTEEGIKQALLAIRRHRLVECFLVKMLNYALDEVHDEAHALEPVISDVFEHKIDTAMGHPRRCPHGDPIPDTNGIMNHDPGYPLTELAEGSTATILRVPGSKTELLRYLLDLGIEPEKPVCLLRREPFGGPLHLKLGRRTVLLGPEAARAIYVSDTENLS